MKLLSWNIKQFTMNKVLVPKPLQGIRAVVEEYDLAVILEGPANTQNQNKTSGQELAEKLAQHLSGSWSGLSAETPALGNEAESVIVVHRDSVEVSNLTVAKGAKYASDWRAPVSFKIKAPSDVSGNAIEKKIMAWHAPKPGEGPAITTCLAALKNDSIFDDIDVFAGDFNSDTSGPGRDFTEVTHGIANSTTLSNPNTQAFGIDNIYTAASPYDKIFVRKQPKTEYKDPGRVNVPKAIQRNWSALVQAPLPAKSKRSLDMISENDEDEEQKDQEQDSLSAFDEDARRKRLVQAPNQSSFVSRSRAAKQDQGEISDRDAITLAYEISDHVPVRILL